MEGDRQVLTVTVVTPEAAVIDRVTCDTVTLPTENGEIGVLPGHTPLLTLLGIGRVTCVDGGRSVAVAVTARKTAWGKCPRSSLIRRYSGRKSCPHSEMQCASSTANKLTD